jgi:hypothetical protein
VRTLLLEHELADPPELKKLEKELKKVPPAFPWSLHVPPVLAC